MTRKQRAQEAFKRLCKFKFPKTGLKNWKKPWQFLFAVILSAQANDDQVNKVTPSLFKSLPTLNDFENASIKQIEGKIKSIGLYKGKAMYLHKTSSVLLKDYNGKVPGKISELVKLPGVGRKTANVYQGVILGKSEGIAVDTHVGRVSRRLKLTNNINAFKVEKDIIKLYSVNQLHLVNPHFFWHGRTICISRKPKCKKCILSDFCPSSKL